LCRLSRGRRNSMWMKEIAKPNPHESDESDSASSSDVSGALRRMGFERTGLILVKEECSCPTQNRDRRILMSNTAAHLFHAEGNIDPLDCEGICVHFEGDVCFVRGIQSQREAVLSCFHRYKMQQSAEPELAGSMLTLLHCVNGIKPKTIHPLTHLSSRWKDSCSAIHPQPDF
jgi:hypothetical protein